MVITLIILVSLYLGGMGVAAGVGLVFTQNWEGAVLFALAWPFWLVVFILCSLFGRFY